MELGGRPVMIPRGWHFNTNMDSKGYDTVYSFVGTGRLLSQYVMVDGVNEAGFGAAALYLVESQYAKAPVAGKHNLASFEVVAYLLGQMHDVAQLRANLDELNIVATDNALLDGNVPLHWIVADKTGDTAVIEMGASGLKCYDNPVGVMTNSPEFPWHLQNLQNYPQLSPALAAGTQYGALKALGAGAGTGALGLPGDYTSVSRFVRMAFLRENVDQVSGQGATINTLSHLLNALDIPRGVKLMANGEADYTQYRAYFDLTTASYFMQPYDDLTITQVNLTDEMVNATSPKEWPLSNQQAFKKLTFEEA